MRILDEEIRLKENITESFNKHMIFWVILVVTVAFDFMTTLIFMHQDGIQKEKNEIIRWLAFTFGIIPGVLLGKIFQIIAAIGFCSLSLKYSRAILLLLIMLNIFAIIINVSY